MQGCKRLSASNPTYLPRYAVVCSISVQSVHAHAYSWSSFHSRMRWRLVSAICKKMLSIVFHEQCILFWHFRNATGYHLDLYKPIIIYLYQKVPWPIWPKLKIYLQDPPRTSTLPPSIERKQLKCKIILRWSNHVVGIWREKLKGKSKLKRLLGRLNLLAFKSYLSEQFCWVTRVVAAFGKLLKFRILCTTNIDQNSTFIRNPPSVWRLYCLHSVRHDKDLIDVNR